MRIFGLPAVQLGGNGRIDARAGQFCQAGLGPFRPEPARGQARASSSTGTLDGSANSPKARIAASRTSAGPLAAAFFTAGSTAGSRRPSSAADHEHLPCRRYGVERAQQQVRHDFARQQTAGADRHGETGAVVGLKLLGQERTRRRMMIAPRVAARRAGFGTSAARTAS